MAKNKNKQMETMVEKERNEEVVTVLNEANDDQVINVDTSALDKELKEADGVGLVMPIRGGFSGKSNKKDKKDDKENWKQSQASSGIKSMFSMFLKGEAEAEEVSCKSEDDIKEILESEDLITLGKFTRKHPEIFSSYFKSIGVKRVSDNEVIDIEVGSEPEYKEEIKMSKLVKVDLSKKERKELRETLSRVMEALDDKLSVKELFGFIEEELGVDVIKIVNTFLDKLDSYDVDEFNKFIKKTVNKIQGTELLDLIEYLTGQDITTTVNFLLDDNEDSCGTIMEMISARVEEIMSDNDIEAVLSVEADDDGEMFLEIAKEFVKVAKKHMKKENKVAVLEEVTTKTRKEENLDRLTISFNKIFFGGEKPKVQKEVDDVEEYSPKKLTPDDLIRKAMALMTK